MHAWLIKGMRLLNARVVVQGEGMVCNTLLTGCMKEHPATTRGATYKMHQHFQRGKQRV